MKEDVNQVCQEVDADEVGVLRQSLQHRRQHWRQRRLLDHPEIGGEHTTQNLPLLEVGGENNNKFGRREERERGREEGTVLFS